MVPNDIDPTVGVAKCEWCKGVNSFGIGITPSSFADSCTSQKESTVVRIKLIIVVLCGLSMVYEARGPMEPRAQPFSVSQAVAEFPAFGCS